MEAFKRNIQQRFEEGMKRLLRFHIAPRRQFKRLMVTAFVLAAALVVFHVYIFYRVETHTIFATDPTIPTPTPVVAEKKLTAVLKRFEEKALVRATAVQLVPAVADPSR